MKNFVKNNYIRYIISAFIFFIIYSILEYIFGETIDWEMAIISTIVFILLEIGNYFFDKKVK